MTQAMSEVFGDAEVRYCLYHFCRALFAHIQKEGLLPLYAIPEAKVLLRSFMALAFAPLEEVVHGYSEVAKALGELLDSRKIPNRFAVSIHSKLLPIRIASNQFYGFFPLEAAKIQ